MTGLFGNHTIARASDFIVRSRLPGILTFPLVLIALCGRACAGPPVPRPLERRIAMAVAVLVERQHVTKHRLDDEISQRAVDAFLEVLDTRKLHFYQRDVDSFLERRNDLDDLLRRGDTSFAHQVLEVLLQRVDERLKLAEELLEMRHDFTVDEEILIDRDETHYPRTEAEAREKWRKWIKYELLLLKADGMEGRDAVEELGRRLQNRSRRFHQVDGEELLETYLTSLTTAFDPHTSYLSPDAYEDFKIDMRLGLEGIGALLQSEHGYAVVERLVPGGAAENSARLKTGDKVVGVGQGEEGEIVDVVDMKLTDVVERIRGKPGTVVRLELMSKDDPGRRVIRITRAKIELKDREAYGEVLEAGVKPEGKPYRIGVIDLPSFYMDMDAAKRSDRGFKSAVRDVERILERFNTQNVDAIVLDLRRNLGGSLPEAVDLTGVFVTEGPVVLVKGADGHVLPYCDLDPKEVWKGPLVVLTSKLSASASEIVAGAIQDYRRGLVVGDAATHGKGTVQTLIDLGESLFGSGAPMSLGALKITTQRYYRPSGASTQNRGVAADVELPSLTAHWDSGEAALDYAPAFDQIDPARFRRYDYVNEGIRNQLVSMSQRRCAKSEEFQKELGKIARCKAQKERKSISLNEEKFLAEFAELQGDDTEEECMEDGDRASRSRVKRDYYLEEVLAITVDYTKMMAGMGAPS